MASLPQGQEDRNATGRDGDHEGQHDHEAEVGLAPVGARWQRQRWPHNLGEDEGDDGADPNLNHIVSDCYSSQLRSNQLGDSGTMYVCTTVHLCS